MDDGNQLTYHRSLLERFSPRLAHEEDLTFPCFSQDGANLSATLLPAESTIGIVIIPGITVPRESYYRLMTSLSPWNTLVFDLRGQGESTGSLEGAKCTSDVNEIKEWAAP
jgi:predicted alpha/beta hydrolase